MRGGKKQYIGNKTVDNLPWDCAFCRQFCFIPSLLPISFYFLPPISYNHSLPLYSFPPSEPLAYVPSFYSPSFLPTHYLLPFTSYLLPPTLSFRSLLLTLSSLFSYIPPAFKIYSLPQFLPFKFFLPLY
jgi:hypothetical protein